MSNLSMRTIVKRYVDDKTLTAKSLFGLTDFDVPSKNSLKLNMQYLENLYWMHGLSDVKQAFNDISAKGQEIQFYAGSNFPDEYDQKTIAGVDISWPKTHFQGIQRLRRGKYIAFTGSGENASHLFVAKLRSTHSRVNAWKQIGTTKNDTVVKIYAISPKYWHAGGFQVLGDYLVVGITGEKGDGSEIVFFDIGNPERPRIIHRLERPDIDSGGAVGIVKLPDERFLLLVGRTDSNVLDFYLSETSSLENPNFIFFETWREEALSGMDSEFGNYQNINLIAQKDGNLFFVGLHNNSDIGGHFGKDWADLFSLELDLSNKKVTIKKIGNKHMVCKGVVNFDAGAGIYFDGRNILVYGIGHYREDNAIFINEFSS